MRRNGGIMTSNVIETKRLAADPRGRAHDADATRLPRRPPSRDSRMHRLRAAPAVRAAAGRARASARTHPDRRTGARRARPCVRHSMGRRERQAIERVAERRRCDVLRRITVRDRPDGFLLPGARRERRQPAASGMRAALARQIAERTARYPVDAADRAICAATLPRRAPQTFGYRNSARVGRVRARVHSAAASVAAQSGLAQAASVVRRRRAARAARQSGRTAAFAEGHRQTKR